MKPGYQVMRMFFMFVSVLVLSVFSAQAYADTQPFCERVAKDFANASSSDVDQWLIDYRTSLGNCIGQQNAAAKADAPVEKAVRKIARKIVIAPANASDEVARKRTMTLSPPGSIAWNNYCAAKYASFNRLTGFYTSRNGKERRCSETLN
jgi:Tfp pilus assembly protein PilE